MLDELQYLGRDIGHRSRQEDTCGSRFLPYGHFTIYDRFLKDRASPPHGPKFFIRVHLRRSAVPISFSFRGVSCPFVAEEVFLCVLASELALSLF